MEGIIVALITPFKGDHLDLDSLKEVTNNVVSSGVNSLFVLGSTGEFIMMSFEERLKVVEALLDHIQKMMVGVNFPSIYESSMFAKKIQDMGVKNVFSIPPIYHKYREENIVKFFESLSKYSENLYLYNFPQAVGYNMQLKTIERLASEGILRGMKYTTSDLVSFLTYMRSLKAIRRDFEVFIGEDRLAADALIYGADGVISGIANVFPKLYLKVYKLIREGKLFEAMEVQKKANEYLDVFYTESYPETLKKALNYLGFNAGNSRLPIKGTPEEDALIYEAVKALSELE